MNGIIETFFLAMTPIGELRAAVPVALAVYKLNWLAALSAAFLGNLVPAALLLLFLEPVSFWFSRRLKFCKRFFDWWFKRAESKAAKRVIEYGWLALIPFVAIPLPFTGAWTASLVAYFFKIPFKKAFPAIGLGVLIAGFIVVLATKAGIAIESYFGLQALIGLVLSIAIISLIYEYARSRSLS